MTPFVKFKVQKELVFCFFLIPDPCTLDPDS